MKPIFSAAKTERNLLRQQSAVAFKMLLLLLRLRQLWVCSVRRGGKECKFCFLRRKLNQITKV